MDSTDDIGRIVAGALAAAMRRVAEAFNATTPTEQQRKALAELAKEGAQGAKVLKGGPVVLGIMAEKVSRSKEIE